MDSTPTRALIAVALVAMVHAAIFAVYQQPDWNSPRAWVDQVGYQRLGHVLATTGKFTRNPDAQPFVPETLRTPVYPLFVALVYRVLGESHTAIAAAQAVLLALLVLIVYALTSRLATKRVAVTAAWFTALFPPLPYYAALALTEIVCTLLVVAAIWTAVRAVQDRRLRDYVLTGVFIGLATLTRPTYAMFPVALVACMTVAAILSRIRRRHLKPEHPAYEHHRLSARTAGHGPTIFQTIVPWSWTIVSFAIVLAPWLAYNQIYFGRLTLSPAGGIGRATWEASWQGTWSGRDQADLTRLVEAHVNDNDATLDPLVTQFAADRGLPVDPMLTYVHQWRDIRRLWDTPTDPRERAIKRVEADGEYWKAGLANIARDRVGHLVRRITTGTFVLWAAEIPIRYTDINTVRPMVIRLIWLIQVGILALGIIGLLVVVQRRGILIATPPATLLAYITIVHLPMLSEARYSLPAKPVVLALAAIALAELLHRILPQTGDYLP